MADSPLILAIPPSIKITDEQFFELCHANRDLCLERDANTGEIWIMTPTGGTTGNQELNLGTQLYLWTERDGTGIAFGPSTGFHLEDSPKQPISPDASWISLSRWNGLSEEEKTKFPPICPDFIIELRSPSDTLESLKKKMQIWIGLGVKLGWLIDSKNRKVYLYRPGSHEECLENPTVISGEPILPGFTLNLDKIW